MSYSVASIVRDAQHAVGQGRGNPFPESEEAGQIWAAAFAAEKAKREKSQRATLPLPTAYVRVPAHIAGAL